MGGVVLLGAALIFVLLFRKLGLGAVLGYLAAGIMVGPQGFALVSNAETILAFSEIGIILLLFLVGLELSPRRLWNMRRDIFLLGPLQVILCGLVMFGIIYMTSGFSWQAALVIGLPLGLSSTAQVLPLLQSRGRLKTDYGSKSFSILLFQDLSIVPLLTLVAALSRAPAEPNQASGWLLGVYALLAIGALVLAGRFLLEPILKLVGRIAERELFIVVGLFTVCASAALMQYLGLSAALGAFVAGVMLAESPYRHEIEADVDPFRSILLGLFFLAVGMMLDLNILMNSPFLIIGMAAALVISKITIIFALGRLFGLPSGRAIIMGLLLSQGGEFGFVLFAAAQQSLLIEAAAVSLFGAVITLSMATTPFLIILAQWLTRRAKKKDVEMDGPEMAEKSNVIIVGHGRFGQTVSQLLQAASVSVVLIDRKPAQIELSEEFGRKVFYGDGTRVDLLRRAGADEASSIIFCIDDRQVTAESIIPIRESFPHANIFVRSFDRRQTLELMPDKDIISVREILESAIILGDKAMQKMGISANARKQIVAEYRLRDGQRLKEQFASGNLKVGDEHSFGLLASRTFTMRDD
ncbi:sodium:proton exchanger [Sphingorhabdus lutea]|uniref:Sodium:proton exchanger n=2 Tax=Sphingorhabdus lutea TaxID=1913578 RepID=A0A1L3JF65_9SPHN|nr:monovalent cation:proton antiporter-2 (CPA2) family protein [Sphingorhabdus lutea]APG63778.1 sodium:proton exchanger [Sphingorhabdus lutea]